MQNCDCYFYIIFIESCDGDIIFVLDASGSIGKDNFEKVKAFTIAAINKLEVSCDVLSYHLAQGGTVNLITCVLHQMKMIYCKSLKYSANNKIVIIVLCPYALSLNPHHY